MARTHVKQSSWRSSSAIFVVIVHCLFSQNGIYCDAQQCHIYDDMPLATTTLLPVISMSTTETPQADTEELVSTSNEDDGSGSGQSDNGITSTTQAPIVTTVPATDPPFCTVLSCSPDVVKACPIKCATSSPTTVPTASPLTLAPTAAPTTTAPTQFVAANRCDCVMVHGGVWQLGRCLHGCFAKNESECESSPDGCASIATNTTAPEFSNCKCGDNPNIANCGDFTTAGCCSESGSIRQLCTSSCGNCDSIPSVAPPPLTPPTVIQYQVDYAKCLSCVNSGGVFNAFDGSSVTTSRCLRVCFTSRESCFETQPECSLYAEVRQASRSCTSSESTCEGCVDAHGGCGWVWSSTHLQGRCIDATVVFPFPRNTCESLVLASDPQRVCVAPTMSPTSLPSSAPTTSLPTNPPTTMVPTQSPSVVPTQSPSGSSPTRLPSTSSPTQLPSGSTPTQLPSTSSPTQLPTTLGPTHVPTSATPTISPSTTQPTNAPSQRPTLPPTANPTRSPTEQPTSAPTVTCSDKPCENGGTCVTQWQDWELSGYESDSGSGSGGDLGDESESGEGEIAFKCECVAGFVGPLCNSTSSPTLSPSTAPTSLPTLSPTVLPTQSTPTLSPTTVHPTVSQPTVSPTSLPTQSPTTAPTTSSQTMAPTTSPSFSPSGMPSQSTSVSPTTLPSGHPTSPPTSHPTLLPSVAPSSQPTTSSPSSRPSFGPTGLPTIFPTIAPSMIVPSISPTHSPTTSLPTFVPTPRPTRAPAFTNTRTSTTTTQTTTSSMLALASENSAAMTPTALVTIIVAVGIVLLLIVLVVQWCQRNKAEEFSPKAINPDIGIGVNVVPSKGFSERTLYREPSTGVLVFDEGNGLRTMTNPVYDAQTFDV
eukprot:m.194703 g.194703  ORF g.194703 m.194703 type:complete len:874 (-) comp32539_c3_seq1:127-2748(-)